MTNEELMKRRCKVIAAYPGSQLRIGDVLVDEKREFQLWRNNRDMITWQFNPEDYPANFKIMEWWEQREPQDMPKYVKHGERFREVKKWAFDSARPGSPYFTWHGDDVGAYVDFFPGCDPATEAEYLAALNTTKQQDNG